MSCKGDWRGRSEAKDVVRERAWAALEASGDARDDDGPRGRHLREEPLPHLVAQRRQPFRVHPQPPAPL